VSTPRTAAIERLARLVPSWPDLPFDERGEGGLADAIVQESVRRWRTLDWFCGTALNRDPASIEAPLRAALLAGSAQLLLMDEADHAVVNDTVEWAKRAIRPGAGNLVNAVLRRIAGWRGERVPAPTKWWEQVDLLPMGDGSALRVSGVQLPEALPPRLAVATSHATPLIERWIGRNGVDEAARIASHALAQAPRLVADPRGVLTTARAHAEPGFVVWERSLPELREAMALEPSLRVQDPGSAAPIELTRGFSPRLIVDPCAGRGTKTAQLAELHPNAEIVAGDIDAVRRRTLTSTFKNAPRVRVMEPDAIMALRSVDLLVLDVPCSNTGVLARRPEAKCRFDDRRLASLLALQRTIVDCYAPLIGSTGRVLYATCSLEAEELDAAADRLTRHLGRSGERTMRLPTGGPGVDAANHRDGGGHMLF